jgi:hypothetical protein
VESTAAQIGGTRVELTVNDREVSEDTLIVGTDVATPNAATFAGGVAIREYAVGDQEGVAVLIAVIVPGAVLRRTLMNKLEEEQSQHVPLENGFSIPLKL